jgi:hypothetical protein
MSMSSAEDYPHGSTVMVGSQSDGWTEASAANALQGGIDPFNTGCSAIADVEICQAAKVLGVPVSKIMTLHLQWAVAWNIGDAIASIGREIDVDASMRTLLAQFVKNPGSIAVSSYRSHDFGRMKSLLLEKVGPWPVSDDLPGLCVWISAAQIFAINWSKAMTSKNGKGRPYDRILYSIVGGCLEIARQNKVKIQVPRDSDLGTYSNKPSPPSFAFTRHVINLVSDRGLIAIRSAASTHELLDQRRRLIENRFTKFRNLSDKALAKLSRMAIKNQCGRFDMPVILPPRAL